MAYCSITTPFKLPNQFELFKSKILSSKTKSQSKFPEKFIFIKGLTNSNEILTKELKTLKYGIISNPDLQNKKLVVVKRLEL